MTIGDVPTWIASIIALVALIFGILGFSQARKANDIADGARQQAKTANQLSEDANKVAARVASMAEEDWFVDWDVRWNEHLGSLILVNKGSNSAIEPRITISGTDLHEVRAGWHEVGPGQDIAIALPEIGKRRADHDAHEAKKVAEAVKSRVINFPTEYGIELKVTIGWKTGLGFPDHAEIPVDVR